MQYFATTCSVSHDLTMTNYFLRNTRAFNEIDQINALSHINAVLTKAFKILRFDHESTTMYDERR